MAAQPKKSDTYQVLYRINHAFDVITSQLEMLRQAGLLKSKMQRVLDASTREVQAQINVQTVQSLSDTENKDWSRFERIREKAKKELFPKD
jgi:hypothetical protein